MQLTKRCGLWVLALALGCGGAESETKSKSESETKSKTESGTKSATATEPFVDSDRLCVPDAMTVTLPPNRQVPIDPPLGKCGNYLGPDAIEQNTISCGPCGFALDRAVTERVRATKPNACCYEVSSPPPPPPPPAVAAPYRCTADADCMNDCAYGAVNRRWYESEKRVACKDGCTSKGTESPRCEAGTCVAYRIGKRDDLCTNKPLE